MPVFMPKTSSFWSLISLITIIAVNSSLKSLVDFYFIFLIFAQVFIRGYIKLLSHKQHFECDFFFFPEQKKNVGEMSSANYRPLGDYSGCIFVNTNRFSCFRFS